MLGDGSEASELALKLLELTITENRNAMASLANEFVEVARSIRLLTLADIERVQDASDKSHAERVTQIEISLTKIICDMQSHDITDQRLSHVLDLLRDPETELNELFTERSEWQLVKTIQGQTSSGTVSAGFTNTENPVELF